MLQGLRRLRKSEVFTFRTFGVPRGPLNPLHYYCVCCPLGRREFFFEFFCSSRAPRGALNRLQYIDVCCHVGPSGGSRGVFRCSAVVFFLPRAFRGPLNRMQYIEVCCHVGRSGARGVPSFPISGRAAGSLASLGSPRGFCGEQKGSFFPYLAEFQTNFT